jgi:hypothetical protein
VSHVTDLDRIFTATDGKEYLYVEAGDTSSRGKYFTACSASAFDAITACDE